MGLRCPGLAWVPHGSLATEWYPRGARGTEHHELFSTKSSEHSPAPQWYC